MWTPVLLALAGSGTCPGLGSADPLQLPDTLPRRWAHPRRGGGCRRAPQGSGTEVALRGSNGSSPVLQSRGWLCLSSQQ